jgi:hypothetical protein
MWERLTLDPLNLDSPQSDRGLDGVTMTQSGGSRHYVTADRTVELASPRHWRKPQSGRLSAPNSAVSRAQAAGDLLRTARNGQDVRREKTCGAVRCERRHGRDGSIDPSYALDNGFLSCADPVALQTACDLSPADVQAFFDRWSPRLPWPVPAADRRAGCDHRLAINQLEVNLTQVFDRPVQGRLSEEKSSIWSCVLWNAALLTSTSSRPNCSSVFSTRELQCA